MPTPAASLPQTTDSKMLGFPGPTASFGLAPPSEANGSSVVAANYTAPIRTPVLSEAGALTSLPQGKEFGTGPTRGLSPLPPGAGNLLPLDHPVTTGRPDATACQSSAALSSPPSDQFEYVQDRLRKMGATYYLLETCGDAKREFRFYCKMSIGGNPRVTRPFWSVEADPLKAMTMVLKQIEDWQTGGG